MEEAGASSSAAGFNSSGSDSSEQELIYDVPWDDTNPLRFDINDPYSLSPQFLAVLHNDIAKLKKLFKKGLSPNTNDNNGNTSLHFAAMKEKTDVFLYLLKRRDIRLDAQNFAGLTTLALVLIEQNYYYAKKLLKAGASINTESAEKNSPIHYAIHDLEMTKILLDKGADVNAVNWYNESPLFLACDAANPDVAFELIGKGADPNIRTNLGMIAFDKAISKCNCKELTDLLFQRCFNKCSTCTLFNIINSSNTEYFDIFTRQFTCDEYSFDELLQFGRYLKDASVKEFETLLNTNPDIIIDFFSLKDMLHHFCSYISLSNSNEKKQGMLDKLEMLFSNTDVITEIMETYQQHDALIWHLAVKDLIDLNDLTKLSCLFMIHGVHVYALDLDTIYRFYGYCELFEIMLHMDIVDEFPDVDASLMSVLMYNMDFEMEVCLQKPDENIFEESIDRLVEHFALPKFKEYCLRFTESSEIERVKNLPAIPSLVELSRNAARKLIKKKFNVKTSRQFHTILNSLPIPKCHKDIISFKTSLYNV